MSYVRSFHKNLLWFNFQELDDLIVRRTMADLQELSQFEKQEDKIYLETETSRLYRYDATNDQFIYILQGLNDLVSQLVDTGIESVNPTRTRMNRHFDVYGDNTIYGNLASNEFDTQIVRTGQIDVLGTGNIVAWGGDIASDVGNIIAGGYFLGALNGNGKNISNVNNISASTMTLTTSLSVPSFTASNLTVQTFTTSGVLKNNPSGLVSSSLIVNSDIATNANITDDKLSQITTTNKVHNSATSATSSNIPNTIVSRDSNGAFSSGAITSTSLSTGAITATTISSTTITCTGINTQNNPINAGTGNITGGLLNSSSIITGAITASSLAVGSGSISGGMITGTSIEGTSLSAGAGTISGGSAHIATSSAGGDKWMFNLISTNNNNPNRCGMTIGKFAGALDFSNGCGIRISSGSGTGNNGSSVFVIQQRNDGGGGVKNFLNNTYDVGGTMTTTFGHSATDNMILTGVPRLTNLTSGIVRSSANGTLSSSLISATDINNNIITGDKLVNGTITSLQIADATITGAKLTNGTITSTQIANSTITGANIANATITNDKLANASTSNTANNIVIRDASGNISCQDIFADDVNCSSIFNSGLAKIVISSTNTTINHQLTLSAFNTTGIVKSSASGVLSCSLINGVNDIIDGTVPTSKLTSVSVLNTANALVQRDVSGNFNANSINLNGMSVNSANFIEFGFGVVGKEGAAGRMGYQTYTPGALDIVGAGTSTRTVKLWDNVIIQSIITAPTANITTATITTGNLTSLRMVGQSGNGRIEMGNGVAGKQAEAGIIAYQPTYAPTALSIVGAGATIGTRNITIFDNLTVMSSLFAPSITASTSLISPTITATTGATLPTTITWGGLQVRRPKRYVLSWQGANDYLVRGSPNFDSVDENPISIHIIESQVSGDLYWPSGWFITRVKQSGSNRFVEITPLNPWPSSAVVNMSLVVYTTFIG